MIELIELISWSSPHTNFWRPGGLLEDPGEVLRGPGRPWKPLGRLLESSWRPLGELKDAWLDKDGLPGRFWLQNAVPVHASGLLATDRLLVGGRSSFL